MSKSSFCARALRLSDGLAAVGEHHGEIDRDPARLVAGAARAQPAQSGGEDAGQAGGTSEIGRQTRSGVESD
ncbi:MULTISPECIES: hypothetical protein [Streptomyces]|uniref:Uncharacterized protein n=1 Tax=Streptomyces capitiformicae TaxID=2014920 RepID=A0A918Z074_9ACTN|nr:hypothetical protein GCM10017771_46380 [Streptomyces capitiformicae]